MRIMSLKLYYMFGVLLLNACVIDPPDSNQTVIRRFQELEIVDESIMNDVRTKNTNNGPWSFGKVMESLTPSEVLSEQFVLDWLREWHALIRQSRPEQAGKLYAKLICPWLKANPQNSCNHDCTHCAEEHLNLDQAPFRLIAISNRMDLGSKAHARFNSGEGRLVFAVTDGPADDSLSENLATTIVVEFGLSNSLSPLEWARAWHALSGFSDFGNDYKQQLEGITNAFMLNSYSGDNFLQLRINDRTFSDTNMFIEFGWNDSRTRLKSRGLSNTPHYQDLEELGVWVKTNQDEVLQDDYLLPSELLAGIVQLGDEIPQIDTVDAETNEALRLGSCQGCHAERLSSNEGFHVSPFEVNLEKLSRFMHDPENTKADDLSRREIIFRNILLPQ